MDGRKKLAELSSSELKTHLVARNLDSSGDLALLKLALTETGENPDTCIFKTEILSETPVVRDAEMATYVTELAVAVQAEGKNEVADELELKVKDEVELGEEKVVKIEADCGPEVECTEILEPPDVVLNESEDELPSTEEQEESLMESLDLVTDLALVKDEAAIVISDSEASSTSSSSKCTGGNKSSERRSKKLDEVVKAKNLWISNLPSSTKSADLEKMFSKYGQVVVAKIVISGRSKDVSYGFVTMSSVDDAGASCKILNASKYGGMTINVEQVTWGEKLMSKPSGIDHILRLLEKERSMKKLSPSKVEATSKTSTSSNSNKPSTSSSSKSGTSKPSTSSSRDDRSKLSTHSSVRRSSSDRKESGRSSLERKYEDLKRDVSFYKSSVKRYMNDSEYYQRQADRFVESYRRSEERCDDLKRQLQRNIRDLERAHHDRREEYMNAKAKLTFEEVQSGQPLKSLAEFKTQEALIRDACREIEIQRHAVQAREDRLKLREEEYGLTGKYVLAEENPKDDKHTAAGRDMLQLQKALSERERELRERELALTGLEERKRQRANELQSRLSPCPPPQKKPVHQVAEYVGFHGAGESHFHESHNMDGYHDNSAHVPPPQTHFQPQTSDYHQYGAQQPASATYLNDEGPYQPAPAQAGMAFATLLQRSQPAPATSSYCPAVQLRRY